MVLYEIWSLGHKPFSDLSNPIVSLGIFVYMEDDNNAWIAIMYDGYVFRYVFAFSSCLVSSPFGFLLVILVQHCFRERKRIKLLIHKLL